MVNTHNQVVCDETGIILNDGVTLFPGYVEVQGTTAIRYDSNDPHNSIYRNPQHKEYKSGMLHHRVEYKYTAHKEYLDDTLLNGKHFMSMKALKMYREKLK